MTKKESIVSDFVVAKGLDVLSGVVSGSRKLEHVFMDTSAASHRSLRWRAARVVLEGMPRDGWPTFPGDQRSGRLARTYKSVGLIGIGKDALTEAGWYGESVHAVAYPIGKATMVAALPGGLTFGEDPDYPDTLLAGLGIGRGPLVGALGRWYPEDKKFVIPTDSELRGIRTYDTADFPSHIPKF